MTRKAHCSPARPPPNRLSDTNPNSTGATAWARERSTVRIASARPQSWQGMMSSRAASSGGFCADRQQAVTIRNGTATTAKRVSSAGMASTTVAVAAAALTAGRPVRCFLLSSASPARPPVSTPTTAPMPSASSTRVASAWPMPYCSLMNSMPNVCAPARKK